jgi:tRNA/tmRNA/rRNA uracil-C5-methylase (TrmA/RlmC/RlmD family)
VLGIEGSEDAGGARARQRTLNGLAAKTSFEARNLFELRPDDLRALGPAERWLIDPPREGAFALAKALADLQKARWLDATACASSTSAATRPRWRATPVCWCTRRATAVRWPAW